ncbi:MAG TPA: hypothetical protein PK079_04280 [Leptospiraceae bacterium]|nr:hypothetical protein [Leptospiraceae bacterium]HMW05455.1 hypothetical protein [Leptospiraceae bacterium]HMX31396.1 hypothetical protein [Leptospiraceae bacterium]HMY30965.1 hypothetical protein [Leptospiraceae bacterium]HMZ63376.1 hypothetical protein [Leptospiraceae bacterium]
MRYLLCLLVCFIFSQCSTTLLQRENYIQTRNALEDKDLEKAIKEFPNGESNSFITSMEKAYLNLIQGKPEINDLIRYAEKIEKRVRYSASREIKTFFYVETPEGYYASEHEIIWLHMLLSWGYSLRGDYEKAYVEAKVSSDLLSNAWSPEGRFDDPLMRIILASLWTLCGHWEEAQVDFRVAATLDPNLQWAQQLADLPEAPKDFILVLGGTGPEPVWNPQLELNPLRGFRSLDFKSNSIKSKLTLRDSNGKTIDTHITPDSTNWYTRHEIRDNEIQDLIKDSIYGQNIAITAVKEGGRSVLGVTAGVLIATGGIVLGGGIIYASVKYGSGDSTVDGVALGLIIMGAGISKGYSIAEEAVSESITNAKKDLDISSKYRFVRFLPDYAWVGYSNQKLKTPIRILNQNQVVSEIKDARNATIVSIDYYPDVIKK